MQVISLRQINEEENCHPLEGIFINEIFPIHDLNMGTSPWKAR